MPVCCKRLICITTSVFAYMEDKANVNESKVVIFSAVSNTHANYVTFTLVSALYYLPGYYSQFKYTLLGRLLFSIKANAM